MSTMILSDRDILAARESGELSIEPFVLENLRPASYRYSLGDLLLRPLPSGVIDTRLSPNVQYQRIFLDDAGYVLKPGEFILGQIAERISLSTGLASFTDGRTHLARLGLEVVMSSMLVEPGQQDSHETLELSNSGPNPICLYPGMPIAKGIFFRTYTPSMQNYSEIGTYVGQTDPTPQWGPGVTE